MNQNLALRWLIPLLLFGWLNGCASVPPVYDPVQDASFQGPTLAVARAQPDAFLQTRVRWGGAIARVENRRDETWVEIVEQPLARRMAHRHRRQRGPLPRPVLRLSGPGHLRGRTVDHRRRSADRHGAGPGRRLSHHLSGRDGGTPPALAGTPRARSDLPARSLLVRPRLSVGLSAGVLVAVR